MHNKPHNTDDKLPFASHVTLRGRTYQYVRRVPQDIAGIFPVARIQRSLRTADKASAYAAAAGVHAEVEKQIADARRSKGRTRALLPVDDWNWEDWQQLAEWFEAVLIEEDWQARMRKFTGATFVEGSRPNLFWRDDGVVREHIALRKLLRDMSTLDYAAQRVGRVQSLVGQIGVPVSKSSKYFLRFMTACLKAESRYLETFFARERGEIEEKRHPDSIKGKWHKALRQDAQNNDGSKGAESLAKAKQAGRTLTESLEQWKKDRTRANKRVELHGISEKESAIDEFRAHARTDDLGEITRSHVIAFRDHLFATGLKTATVNKKVGQITTLLATAQKAGWIETAITGGIYTEVPSGVHEREPFSVVELEKIFSQDTFIKDHRSRSSKAGGELEFWLPLISVTGGLISSEIIQLGHETIARHPDNQDVICFYLTNAGGRSLKAYSRQRYVPIRRELLENGFLDLVESARRENWRTLWEAAEQNPNHGLVSNMFSAFWSRTLRTDLGITDPQKSLYSLRHSFQDAISRHGGTTDEKQQLMGHAEAGMTKKYGTKKKPRVVDIGRLNDLVQAPTWTFLEDIKWPRQFGRQDSNPTLDAKLSY